MMRWTYAVLHADGTMTTEFTVDGPMEQSQIRELLGGELYVSEPTRDGATALRRADGESSGLPLNKHFLKQGVHRHGTILLGKIDGEGRWVGMIGVGW